MSCGIRGCPICRPRQRACPLDSWDRTVEVMRRTLASIGRWREREAERLRRLYPQKYPLQRMIDDIGESRRAAR